MSSTPYSLPPSKSYIDKAGAARYQALEADETVITQVVNATAGAALDSWIQHVWLKGTEITPGEGRGYLNHTVLVERLQLQEQIQSVGLPDDNDRDGVPTILYKVLVPGLLPVVDHLTFVQFVEDNTQEKAQTEIVLSMKFTLAEEGTALIPDPTMISPFFQKAVAEVLVNLATTIDSA
jgi:hypothetical protein